MKPLIALCVLALVAALTVAANRVLAGMLVGYTFDPRWVVLAIVVVPPVYFVPSVLAASRSHPQGTAIFFVNLLLGWTVIGWVACLIWGGSAESEHRPYTPLITPIRPAPKPAPEITAEAAAKALEDLVAQRYQGQITEAEYLSGRQTILAQWPAMPLAAG
jgi:hypothetical protein